MELAPPDAIADNVTHQRSWHDGSDTAASSYSFGSASDRAMVESTAFGDAFHKCTPAASLSACLGPLRITQIPSAAKCFVEIDNGKKLIPLGLS